MTNNITVNTILIDKVRIHPQNLHVGLKNVIRNKLKTRFEGKCSHHGYIVPNSISVYKYSMGLVKAISLNGDVEFIVHYHADVCNPAIGSIFKARIINMNKLGILTQSFIYFNDNEEYPVIDTIVVSQVPSETFKSDVELSHLKIGDEINVEIIGKKFELNDKKISTIGKIIHSNEKTKMVNDDIYILPNNAESNDVYHSDTDTESSNEEEEEDEDSESNNEVQEIPNNHDDNQEEDEDDAEPPEDNEEENNDEEEIEIE